MIDGFIRLPSPEFAEDINNTVIFVKSRKLFLTCERCGVTFPGEELETNVRKHAEWHLREKNAAL